MAPSVGTVSFMLDIIALRTAYDEQLRPADTRNLPPGVHAEPDGPVVRVVGLGRRGFVTGPADLGVDGAELDALIARQRDYFATRGEGVEWKTRGHDRPADLPDRLVAAGFVAEPEETVVIGAAADLATPVAVPGIVVREVDEDADMHRIAAMQGAVWGDHRDWLADELIRRDRSRTVVVVAEADGEVVSSSRLEHVPDTDFAGLWGGATLRRWRGRGIYRALVAYRAALAVARGVRYLQVDASPDSRPILLRLGFVAVTTTTPYVCQPRPT